ncbi:MAG: PQQ-binding-like beta-propeller repeat protein [Alistipes sp.]|nr:PQQ-binding-like beta-propeller repeat protein [Alistipes sp.]
MKPLLSIIFAIFSTFAVYAESKPLKIALLTDLHISPGNKNDKVMKRVIEQINSEYYDLVITAGDITNMGSDKELRCAYNHLRQIRHRQIVTHGNHETTWSESGGRDFEKYWHHNGCTTARVGGYLFVAYPAGPYMKMADGTAQDGNRLSWIEKQLQRGRKGRIISICHYPLNDDLTNRTEIVSLLKRYGVSASLCGHYHKPQLMNFDSLPGILGRSLMLKEQSKSTYGYTELTLRGDSIFVAERLIGEAAVPRYAIRQCTDSTVNSLPCDPMPEKPYNGNFRAECVITDNAAIYTAAQVTDRTLYYGNSAGEVKAYNIDTKQFIWTRRFSDPIYSSPIIHRYIIIVPTLSNGIVALNRKSGKVVWRNRECNCFVGGGVIADNYLYIGMRGAMLKIDPNSGKIVWRFAFGDAHPQGRPTVSDGKIVFGAWDCNLYCVDCQSGKELWRWSNGSKNRLFSPGHIIPRISGDRVMIVAPDRHITNIDLNTGREIWRVKERRVRESTGLSNDGNTFYAKTMDGEMIAVPMACNSYTEQWVTNVGWGYDHNFCPLAVSDGVVYMASRRGKIAAVNEQGKTLSVGKFASSAANDLRIDSSGELWVSFIEGTIWHLSISK